MSVPQNAAIEAGRFVAKVNDLILFPLIILLIAIAFLVFLYGCAEYVFNAANESARGEGRTHIMYGLIGMVVMVSALAIITIAINTFGLRAVLDCAQNPSASGCDSTFRVP